MLQLNVDSLRSLLLPNTGSRYVLKFSSVLLARGILQERPRQLAALVVQSSQVLLVTGEQVRFVVTFVDALSQHCVA